LKYIEEVTKISINKLTQNQKKQ